MSKLKINDIAVVGVPVNALPIGEAPGKGDDFSKMTVAERADMGTRLFAEISELMENAHETHLKNNKIASTGEIDPNYITRLSTNEFFFYTQEPLTLKEFEDIQNKIAEQAENYPAGIHLALGSFAVLTPENKVMNVVPHITCGKPPEFNFPVKNYTSPIDVQYSEITEEGHKTGDYLDTFDSETPSSNELPEITVNGTTHKFSFDNIIHSKTPGNEPFITAVDICLDHGAGVAASNLKAHVQTKPELKQQPISHIIISNFVVQNVEHCLGPVMQVDPVQSPNNCRYGVTQTTTQDRKQPKNFGKSPTTIYDLSPTPCLSVKDAMEFSEITAEAMQELEFYQDITCRLSAQPKYASYAEDINTTMKQRIRTASSIQDARECLVDLKLMNKQGLRIIEKRGSNAVDKQIEELEKLKFGNDDLLSEFISQKRTQYSEAQSVGEELAIIVELEQTIQALKNNEPSEYIRAEISSLRNEGWSTVTVGNNHKANLLEDAMSKIPIDERGNLHNSGAYKDVMKVLASNPGWVRTNDAPITEKGKIDKTQASASFVDFKVKFKHLKGAKKQELQAEEQNLEQRGPGKP